MTFKTVNMMTAHGLVQNIKQIFVLPSSRLRMIMVEILISHLLADLDRKCECYTATFHILQN